MGVNYTGARVYRNGKFEPTQLVVAAGAFAEAAAERGPVDATVRLDHAGTVDLTGRYVIPGLIDAHAHVVLSGAVARDASLSERALRGVANARCYLAAGITAIRDVGGPGSITLELAAAIDRGDVPGPRVRTSGSFVCGKNGHVSYWGLEASGTAEVAEATRALLAEGAHFIKLMASGGVADENESPDQPQLSRAEIAAAVDEATRAGTYAAAHAHPAAAIKDCLLAGVRTIEHASFIDDECCDLALERGATIVPTFAVYARMASDPGLTAGQRDLAARILDGKSGLFLKAVERGVNWAVGTDAGTFQPPGLLREELAWLHKLGLPAATVLDAATRGNADLLGLNDTGRLEPGYRADFVVLDHDPLSDFTALASPAMVVQAGNTVYTREDFQPSRQPEGPQGGNK